MRPLRLSVSHQRKIAAQLALVGVRLDERTGRLEPTVSAAKKVLGQLRKAAAPSREITSLVLAHGGVEESMRLVTKAARWRVEQSTHLLEESVARFESTGPHLSSRTSIAKTCSKLRALTREVLALRGPCACGDELQRESQGFIALQSAAHTVASLTDTLAREVGDHPVPKSVAQALHELQTALEALTESLRPSLSEEFIENARRLGVLAAGNRRVGSGG